MQPEATKMSYLTTNIRRVLELCTYAARTEREK